MCRTVWIVGAGFSYPLGAPLFGQLYGEANARLSNILASRYTNDPSRAARYRVARTEALSVYSILCASGVCRNPEEFLQKLCDAFEYQGPIWDYIQGDVRQEIIRKKFRGDESRESREAENQKNELTPADYLAEIVGGARDELALEVSLFLDQRESGFESEKWEVYSGWLRKLKPGKDVIITFNYDQAIERLDDSLHVHPIEKKIEVVHPHSVGASDSNRVPLYKLHGSVGWSLPKTVASEKQHKVEPIVSKSFLDYANQNLYPMIFVPGPEKMKFAKNLRFWDGAMNEIAKASIVNFIGYRFPESDMYAQSRICSAMPFCQTNVVLGSNTSNEARRMDGLLRPIVSSNLRVEPLFAQDILRRFVETEGIADSV